MSTLEYTIYGIKRGWRISRTFVFSGAFAALVVNGIFTQAQTGGSAVRTIAVAMGALWALFLALKVRSRFFGTPPGAQAASRADLELGLLLILGTYAGIQVAGGLSSPFYPALLILVAFLVVQTEQWVGFTLVAASIGIEFAVVAKNLRADAYRDAGLHAVFIAVFALINLVFTRTEITRVRRRAMKRIEQVKSQIASDARAFRLTSATSKVADASTLHEEQERLSRCTVAEVRRSMYHHIHLLKQTMNLHTCALFWKSEDDRGMQLLECASDSEAIGRRLYRTREGIMGAIAQTGETTVLKDLRAGHSNLVYYTEPTRVTDFLGVPVMEGSTVRGVLCGDRTDNRPFAQSDSDIFRAAVDSILQTVENERVFVQLQKAKSEQGRLLQASESLSKALNTTDVVSSSLEAASLIAPWDMAAIALSRDDQQRQKVVDARGVNAERLKDLELTTRSGLAGSVFKSGHFLPWRGNFDVRTQVVYTKSVQDAFNDMQSLLVLPLMSSEQVMGTLMLASTRKGAYTDDIRNALQVMINQLGTKLQNAQMVQKLKEMATTDGLTGLPNRRSFQDELARQLAHSNRFNTPTSIILCDVDKFKGVNDTYGHSVGDEVLKVVGRLLKEIVVRDTDMPSRYGGEEFIIICGGTDTNGATQLADRIRREMAQQVFQTEKGELRCTISMGVCTFPELARTKEDLINRADAALYAAKEGGRNQVQVWKKGMTVK